MADEQEGQEEQSPRVKLEIQLPSGRVVRANLNNITWGEIREYSKGAPFGNSPEENRENMSRYGGIVTKVFGLEEGEWDIIGYHDFHAMDIHLAKILEDPLNTDPS